MTLQSLSRLIGTGKHAISRNSCSSAIARNNRSFIHWLQVLWWRQTEWALIRLDSGSRPVTACTRSARRSRNTADSQRMRGVKAAQATPRQFWPGFTEVQYRRRRLNMSFYVYILLFMLLCQSRLWTNAT